MKTSPLAVSTATSCLYLMVVLLSHWWPFLSLAVNCFHRSEVGRERETTQNEWVTVPESDLPRVWVGEFVTFEGALAWGGGCVSLTCSNGKTHPSPWRGYFQMFADPYPLFIEPHLGNPLL